MDLRTPLRRHLASQLGNPRGPLGQVVAARLNRSNRALVSTAVDALGDLGGATAADVGFGGGVGLVTLLRSVGATGCVYGVEMSASMLARAHRRFPRELSERRLALHHGSLTQLPLANASLDAAITTNTLYFVPELAAALGELARVVKPAGRVAIGIGDPEAMANLPVTEHGFRLRPVAAIITGMTESGFAVKEDRRVGDPDTGQHLLLGVRHD
jgi:arsenite methyltransferase